MNAAIVSGKPKIVEATAKLKVLGAVNIQYEKNLALKNPTIELDSYTCRHALKFHCARQRKVLLKM